MLIQIVIKLLLEHFLFFPFPNSQDTSNRHMHYFLIDKLEKCNLKLGLLKSIDNGSKTASSTTLLLLFFPVLMVGISQWKKHSSNFCLQARKKNHQLAIVGKNYIFTLGAYKLHFLCSNDFPRGKKCKWISIENQISISFLS